MQFKCILIIVAGYVGAGMLTAAISGAVFASPPPSSILAALRAIASPAGENIKQCLIAVSSCISVIQYQTTLVDCIQIFGQWII